MIIKKLTDKQQSFRSIDRLKSVNPYLAKLSIQISPPAKLLVGAWTSDGGGGGADERRQRRSLFSPLREAVGTEDRSRRESYIFRLRTPSDPKWVFSLGALLEAHFFPKFTMHDPYMGLGLMIGPLLEIVSYRWAACPSAACQPCSVTSSASRAAALFVAAHRRAAFRGGSSLLHVSNTAPTVPRSQPRANES